MRFTVHVRFGADLAGIVVEADEITISIKSPPKQGKANAELVKKLSKHFGVPPNSIRIISGLTSRKKLVEIMK